MRARKRDYGRMYEYAHNDLGYIFIENKRFEIDEKSYDHLVGRVVNVEIVSKVPGYYPLMPGHTPEVILYFYVFNKVRTLFMSYKVYKENLEKYLNSFKKKKFDVTMVPTLIRISSSVDLGMGRSNQFEFNSLRHEDIEAQVKHIKEADEF